MKGYEFIKVLGGVSIIGNSVCVYQENGGNKVRIQVEDICKRVRGYADREFSDMNGLELWLCREFGDDVTDAGLVFGVLNYLRSAA